LPLKYAEFELVFVDAVEMFTAGDGDFGPATSFASKAEERSRLHSAIFLFDGF
jgi:hypothetical protein